MTGKYQKDIYQGPKSHKTNTYTGILIDSKLNTCTDARDGIYPFHVPVWSSRNNLAENLDLHFHCIKLQLYVKVSKKTILTNEYYTNRCFIKCTLHKGSISLSVPMWKTGTLLNHPQWFLQRSQTMGHGSL